MNRLLPCLAALSVAAVLATPAAAQDKVRLVVGGKSAVFYLPLSVTERLGYFKDAGLDVEISDVQSGARALQSVVGGSAEMAVGTFDHTIQMQAKHQPVVAVVQFGRDPGLVLATINSKPFDYRSPKDLKGKKIGVTSPGSSTNFMVTYMMVRAGLKPDDASYIGTGVTATAVAAVKRAEIDAIVSSDPMVTLMESEKLIKVVADSRTDAGSRAIYGGPYPGGVVYTTPAYIKDNPKAVQAVVNAFSRGLKWIASHSAADIAKLMPEEYALGNLPVYIRALDISKPMYSKDGNFVPGAVQAAYDVLKMFDPAVAAAKIDVSKAFDDRFIKKTLAAQ